MAGPEQKLAVCFVALNSYNVLAGDQSLRHVGGAEVQQVIMARWLASRGHDVRFVTLDHRQPEGQDCGGIRIHKAYRKTSGLPGVRFVTPRWTGLWTALGRSGSTVFYQRGAGAETGQVALWCRIRRRPFMFGVASEADCDPDLPFLTATREKVLYRLGLRLADAVLAQTVAQQALLRRNFGVTSALVRSCAPDAGDRTRRRSSGRDAPVVLWIGRIVPVKRFEWLLEVAGRCPEITFRVVGAVNTDSGYVRELMTVAARCGNLQLLGEVPHARMESFYAGADLLLCTSRQEGFPNTFLEAWRVGVPVVTTYDPDGLVQAQMLGAVASSVDEIVGALGALLGDAAVYERASSSVRRYFGSHHTPETALPAFERVAEGLTPAGRLRGRG